MAIDRISPRWTSRFLLVLIGLCAALVLGEVLIRAVYGDRYSRRPAFYGPHDDLGWAPSPNLDHHFYGADFVTHIRTA
jgi:hypothetical protein